MKCAYHITLLILKWTQKYPIYNYQCWLTLDNRCKVVHKMNWSVSQTFIVSSANWSKSLFKMASLMLDITPGTMWSARYCNSLLVLTLICIASVLPMCFLAALTYPHQQFQPEWSRSKLPYHNFQAKKCMHKLDGYLHKTRNKLLLLKEIIDLLKVYVTC